MTISGLSELINPGRHVIVLSMKRFLLVFTFLLLTYLLPAESFFAFGLGVADYNVILKNKSDSSYSGTVNVYPGISCTYFVGNKMAFYVSANFQYLASLYLCNTGGNPGVYEVGLGLRNNIAADLTLGTGYIFRFRDERVRLFMGGGVHTGMPHIPYNDDNDENTEDILILGFNIGLGGKVLLQIQYLFISLDFIYDFALFSSKFPDSQFSGLAIVPAIGFIYKY